MSTIYVDLVTRSGTSSEWIVSNPILKEGEIGYDSTKKRFKIGNGVLTWTQLNFYNAVKTFSQNNLDIDGDVYDYFLISLSENSSFINLSNIIPGIKYNFEITNISVNIITIVLPNLNDKFANNIIKINPEKTIILTMYYNSEQRIWLASEEIG